MENKLKEYMEHRGVRVRDLANKVGCTDQTIYNIQRHTPRSLTLLRRIAKALRAPISKVFPED